MIIKDTKNKKIIRKPNAKTNIVEAVNHYHKIVNVKNQKVFKKIWSFRTWIRKMFDIF